MTRPPDALWDLVNEHVAARTRTALKTLTESEARAHLLGVVETLIAAGVIQHENELPMLRDKLAAWRKTAVIRATKARRR